MMKQQVKQVPYGVSDFATVMSQNLYYVDKTMFLPELEKQPRNLVDRSASYIPARNLPGTVPGFFSDYR
jgi:hypothetical protein